MKQTALPPHIARILAESQPRLLALGGGSHYPLYHLLRVTAAQVAPVDSFYIGFFCDDNTAMLFPYTYDGEEADDPDKSDFAPDGITATLLSTLQPYCYHDDNGALLNKGRRFGDMERKSQDTVVVPLLMPEAGSGPHIFGLMGMLTYTPNSYTPDTARALQWLADTFVTVLQRERDDADRRRELGMTKEADAGDAVSVAQIVDEAVRTIGSIRRHAQAIRAALPPGDAATGASLAELCRECEKGQTDTIELLSRARPDPRQSAVTPDQAAARSGPAAGAGAVQRRDRRPPVHLPQHRQDPHRQHFREAGSVQPLRPHPNPQTVSACFFGVAAAHPSPHSPPACISSHSYTPTRFTFTRLLPYTVVVRSKQLCEGRRR